MHAKPLPEFCDGRSAAREEIAKKLPSASQIYIAGQVALDSTGTLVGVGDFAAQTEQVFANLRRALASAGATFSDVVKMTILSTDASKLSVVREIRARYLDRAQAPASTFMEVRGLARSEWLIENEAIAVVR